MTLEEFDDHLLRYGHDLNKWPAHRRTEARQLCSANDTAQSLLAEAAALTGELQQALAPNEPDSAISARVQSALQRRQARQSAFGFLPIGRLAALGSLAGLAGIVAGLLAPAGGQAVILLLMATGSVSP